MVRLICFLAVGGNANVPCRSVWGMVAFPIESHIAMSGAMNRPVCGSVEELCSRQLQNTNMFNSLCTRHCYRVSVHGIVMESLDAALLRSLCTRHCYGVFGHGIVTESLDTALLRSLCTRHCYGVFVRGIVTESLCTALLRSLWTRHCYGVSGHSIVTESLDTALLQSLCTRHCYGMCLRDRTVFIHGIDGRTPDTEVLCQAVSPLPAVRVNRFSGFPIVFERRPCVRLCWIY